MTMVTDAADASATQATQGLAEIPTERLEAQICALAARLAMDECQWLLLIAEFDRRDAYAVWECRSTAYWLSWHCGLSIGAGRERVRVARALEDLPLIRTAFARGELTYSKVRAITRVATAGTEESLHNIAMAATAAQLERICSAYRSADRGPEPHDEQVERQSLHTWHDDHGMTRLMADIVPEDGALVEAAIAAAREQLRDTTDTSGVSAETHSRVDGLVEMARSYLSDSPVPPNVERRHLVALVDVGDLTVKSDLGFDANGRCTLNGQRLTPEVARELGLNAAMTTILLDHHALPLSVGRRSRTATKAQRLALEIRDGGHCRFPGCPSRFVDAHHIIEWENLGLTDLDNLVLLCRPHHRRIHHGGYSISLDATTGAVEVTGPDGSVVQAIDADAGEAPEQIDAECGELLPGEAGVRLELDHIVDCLIWEDDHGAAA